MLTFSFSILQAQVFATKAQRHQENQNKIFHF